MKVRLLCIFLLLCTLPAVGQSPKQNDDAAKDAVEAVLSAQRDAWNRHALDALMTGYWKSPELTFFSGADEHDGWPAAVGRYHNA